MNHEHRRQKLQPSKAHAAAEAKQQSRQRGRTIRWALGGVAALTLLAGLEATSKGSDSVPGEQIVHAIKTNENQVVATPDKVALFGGVALLSTPVEVDSSDPSNQVTVVPEGQIFLLDGAGKFTQDGKTFWVATYNEQVVFVDQATLSKENVKQFIPQSYNYGGEYAVMRGGTLEQPNDTTPIGEVTQIPENELTQHVQGYELVS